MTYYLHASRYSRTPYDRSHPPDRGCDLHPSCLACPFPVCRYDLRQHGVRTFNQIGKQQQVLDLLREGVPPDVVSRQTGYSKRNVFHISRKYGDRDVAETLTLPVLTR